MKHFVGSALAATALAAVPAMPAAAEELDPSSDWSLDYADDSCALRRSFGEGEGRVWLEIRQLAPSTAARVTVAAADFTKSRRKAALDRAPILRFLPAGTAVQYGLQAFGEYGDGLQALAVYALIIPPSPNGDPAAPPRLVVNGRTYLGHSSRSDAIELSGAFERDVVLKTGDLQKPFDAMNACLDDLGRHWDLASAQGVALSQTPLPRNQVNWAEPIMERFPRDLLRFADEVTIRARVIVSADGKAEQCRIIEPVVDADYEQRTCGVILADGEYEPARDVAGQPVRELYIQNIVYHSAHFQRLAAVPK